MQPIWLGFLFVLGIGACVGSFLNVVILRVPKGMSIVTPPSACPGCGHRLAFYDNIPILGWFFLGGKCRYCKNPISFQYPMIEAMTASLFAVIYHAYYIGAIRPDIVANPQAGWQGVIETFPVLLIHLFLIGSLIASAVIDARYYIIPLPIVWIATGIGIIGAPLAARILPGPVVPPQCNLESLGIQFSIMNGIPSVGNKGVGMALGGVVGLVVANLLLMARILPRGFDESRLDLQDLSAKSSDKQDSTDEQISKDAPKDNSDEGSKEVEASSTKTDPKDDDLTPPPPDEWIEFPHPRLEALKELLFVLVPFAGMVIGYMIPKVSILPSWPVPNPYSGPLALHILGGVVCGYLFGAGLIWGTRIFGTLLFGREAMGLGDLHLLGAIGAVLGPLDAIFVFFMAPFLGLAYSLATFGLLQVMKVRYKPIPYGPHLCIATIILMILHHPIYVVLRRYFLCG
jgi:leader peptidase (prepilin peptidase)/N-methyltransferase